MRKLVNLAVLLVLILITLTGCVTVNYELTINSDGSGEMGYIYAVDRSFLENMEMTAEDFATDMQEKAHNAGYTTEPYADKDIEGFRATKKLKNVTEEFSLEEVFGEENIKDQEDHKIVIDKGMLVTKYSQKARIDLTSMAEQAGVVSIKYSVNLPARVWKNNANIQSKNGKTLTWVLTPGKENAVEFEARELTVMGKVLILVSFIVGIALIAILILQIAKKLNDGKVIDTRELERTHMEDMIDEQDDIDRKI